MIYGGHFDGDSKLKHIDELEHIINDPNFWNNRENAENVINAIKNAEPDLLDLRIKKWLEIEEEE